MKTKNQRIFSAVQPSGELHIGNYFGALKNFTELQNKYECFFFVADYHSISGNYDPKEKSKQVLDLAKDFLAIGLNPDKCVIAVQSQIPEHTELAWIFNTITPLSELQRMTQFKDKSQVQEKNINMGLLDYPVLQAADILIYKAYAVPVGQDQVQHIELTRKIARFFNNKFGETFPEPKDLITETPRIMSLIDPSKKMSKSHGLKSYIGINDPPEVIKQKLKKAVTDIGTTGKITPATENLFLLLEILDKPERYKEFANQHKKGIIKYGQLKEVLADDIIDYFAPFRAKREEFETKSEYVKEILADGAERARKIAKETMREVKEKIGLNI
jgi:tryptophanyl-tRNA synthetase